MQQLIKLLVQRHPLNTLQILRRILIDLDPAPEKVRRVWLQFIHSSRHLAFLSQQSEASENPEQQKSFKDKLPYLQQQAGAVNSEITPNHGIKFHVMVKTAAWLKDLQGHDQAHLRTWVGAGRTLKLLQNPAS